MINPMQLLTLFAADDIKVSLAAEQIFSLGPFTITNSHILGWIAAVLIGWFLLSGVKKIKVTSTGGITQFLEIAVDFVLWILTPILGSRKAAVRFAPLFATLFLFILLNNWMGLLPGVGKGIYISGDPLFRPLTADLNGTIALALFGVVMVQVLSIRENGGLNHLKHYFGGNFKNPINIFVGVLEMFGELTRVISLSLRLFFNIMIGKILITIFSVLGGVAAPFTTLLFIVFELFVGLIQSYIFTMLCATYLGATMAHEDHHEEHEAAQPITDLAEVKT